MHVSIYPCWRFRKAIGAGKAAYVLDEAFVDTSVGVIHLTLIVPPVRHEVLNAVFELVLRTLCIPGADD